MHEQDQASKEAHSLPLVLLCMNRVKGLGYPSLPCMNRLVGAQGRYKSVMVAVSPCRSDMSRRGLAPWAHLADGRLTLVLVRDCSILQYLRFLTSIPRFGAPPRPRLSYHRPHRVYVCSCWRLWPWLHPAVPALTDTPAGAYALLLRPAVCVFRNLQPPALVCPWPGFVYKTRKRSAHAGAPPCQPQPECCMAGAEAKRGSNHSTSTRP